MVCLKLCHVVDFLWFLEPGDPEQSKTADVRNPVRSGRHRHVKHNLGDHFMKHSPNEQCSKPWLVV